MDLALPSGPTLHVVLVLIAVTLAYVIQHYLGRSQWLKERTRLADPELSQARAIYGARIVGGLVLGGVPGLLAWSLPGPLGFAFPLARPTLLFWAIVLLLVLPTVAASMHRPAAWSAYPPVRFARWDLDRLLVNGLTWGVYLCGYELCFRGVLLFGLAPALGDWPALAVMTAIYVLVHLDKPASEAVGTLPMGFVFGLSALYSGSFLPAFLAHWVIAVTSDLAAIRANPSLTFGRPS
ncbi:MAG: CPBP family intramembrane metalloprotease [Deltaproteobacteria bacterium]|nr:CPBP family intramembrane metalloprotease [Deltaproteobacteria bacterium]